MSDSPRTDEVWGSMHSSGYQMMLLAEKLERELAAKDAELSTYRQWAEVEIADLRDDVKRHIEIASFNSEDSLQWRTMFQNERNHMNAAQEEIERLKESLRLLQAQYCRTIDPLLEDDGETPKYKTENERLRGELAEAREVLEHSERNAKIQYEKWKQADSRLRDSCLEGRGDQEFPPCARAIEAEARAAADYDLLRKCSHYLHWVHYGECRTQEEPVPDAVELVELIDAAMGERDAAADKYRKDNPLGGPANMFDAIASRIRLGEEYYAVLADFDVTVGALNQAESRAAAANDLLRECRAMLDGLEAQPLIYRIDAAIAGEKK
jgi:hypothetical protein